MYSKKKKEASKSKDRKSGGKGQALMEQMGMLPDMMAGGGMSLDDDDDDDDDLEAELLALQGGGSPKKPKAKPKKDISMQELDRMVSASMREYGSDEDLSDTDDPSLMAELEELTTEDSPEAPRRAEPVQAAKPPPVSSGNQVALLEERLEMYATAESNAKSAGDSSKARRMNRGLKTLQDLLKKAKSGKTIAEDDIPPAVAAGGSKTPSQKSSPEDDQPPPTSQPRQPPQPTQPHQPPPPQVYAPTTVVTHKLPSYGEPAARPQALVPPQGLPRAPSPEGPRRPTELSTSRPSQPQPVVTSDLEKQRVLTTRRDQYKAAALDAKRAGDNMTAVKYIKTAKQFDQVIEALQEGKPIDLSNMPPPPTAAPVGVAQPPPPAQPVARSAMQASADSSPQEMEVPELSQQDKQKLFKAPDSAGSVMEALQQRLAKYKSSQAEAQEQGNSSKAKRMGRITKQYEDAIKSHKAGRPVDYEDLPCPPGFPPIPTAAKGGGPSPATTPGAAASAVVPPAAIPAAQKAAAPAPPVSDKRAAPGPPHPQPVNQKPKMNRQMSAMSRAEQQTIFLQERQLQFKKAALQAKKNQDMELAKKYLRFAKGFDQMIEASHSGLPVDMSQVPPPPNTGEEKFEFVDADQCTGDREEMYKKLEQEMIQQIRTCSANADNFTHLGDVSSATKFDRMGQNCRKDLDTLRNAYKHGDPVPRFHYENRQFSMVKCCTDLGDNDLEILLLRGINYGLPSGYAPKDLDTYVKFDFPYPNDDPQTGQSDTCKHTASPEYNQNFKLQINRKSRGFLRLLKSSKCLKFEVYYKRGFLKGDKLLGSVNVKLHPLENQCEIHESTDLMDGRKASGGKLEFKVRVRDPFVSKQVEEIKEKWLIIDKFERALKPQANAPPKQKPVTSSNTVPANPQSQGRAPPAANNFSSIEVLKYEKQLLDQQIRKYQGRLNKAEEDSLRHKSELIVRQIEETKGRLQSGGATAYRAYADGIERIQNGYVQEAKALVQQGNREKAQVALNKKKLIEREVETIRSKLTG